nr:G protein-coupled receptor [Proales similis]
MCINFFVGSVLNLWFLWTILTERKLQNPKFWGIINLGCVDLILCLISSPLQIFREAQIPVIGLSSKTCSIILFISTWACLSSIISLVIISIERYFVFKNNRHMSSRAFTLWMIGGHSTSFLFGLLNSFMQSFKNSWSHDRCIKTHSNNNQSIPNAIDRRQQGVLMNLLERVFTFSFLLMALICLFITAYCYYKIYRIIQIKRIRRLNLNACVCVSNFRSKSSCAPRNSANPVNSTRQILNKKDQRRTGGGQKSFSSMRDAASNLIGQLSHSKQLINANQDIVILNESCTDLKRQYCSVASNNVQNPSEGDVFVVNPRFSRLVGQTRDRIARIINERGTSSLETKAIRRTVIPFIVFSIFWIPFLVIQFAYFYKESTLIEVLNLASVAIGYCHSSINPIVYCATNSEIGHCMLKKIKRSFLAQSENCNSS